MNPHNHSGPGHDHTDVDWEVMADQLENSGELQLPVLHRTATHLTQLPEGLDGGDEHGEDSRATSSLV